MDFEAVEPTIMNLQQFGKKPHDEKYFLPKKEKKIFGIEVKNIHSQILPKEYFRQSKCLFIYYFSKV